MQRDLTVDGDRTKGGTHQEDNGKNKQKTSRIRLPVLPAGIPSWEDEGGAEPKSKRRKTRKGKKRARGDNKRSNTSNRNERSKGLTRSKKTSTGRRRK